MPSICPRTIYFGALALVLAGGLPAQAQGSRCATPAEGRRPSVQDSAASAAMKAVADSLHAAIHAAAAEEGIASPAGLVVVELTDARGVAGARVVRGNVPDGLAGRVVAGLDDLLSEVPPRHDLLHVRLDRPELPEGRVVQCRPLLRNPRGFQQTLTRIARAALPPETTRPSPMTLKMLVDRDGEVVHAALSRHGYSARVDRDVVEAAHRLRFLPATVGGVAVDVWVEQPIVLSAPR